MIKSKILSWLNWQIKSKDKRTGKLIDVLGVRASIIREEFVDVNKKVPVESFFIHLKLKVNTGKFFLFIVELKKFVPSTKSMLQVEIRRF